jgi:hypothetical protein
MLNPFFVFLLKAYDSNQVYNMFSIILDHQFKHLCVIKNYVGRMNTIHFIVKYDLKVIIALFMNFFIN